MARFSFAVFGDFLVLLAGAGVLLSVKSVKTENRPFALYSVIFNHPSCDSIYNSKRKSPFLPYFHLDTNCYIKILLETPHNVFH